MKKGSGSTFDSFLDLESETAAFFPHLFFQLEIRSKVTKNIIHSQNYSRYAYLEKVSQVNNLLFMF